MNDEKAQLEATNLILGATEQKIDESRVVLVAKPEIVVDKIREIQEELRRRIEVLNETIKRLRICTNCEPEEKVYTFERKSCESHEVEANISGAFQFDGCSYLNYWQRYDQNTSRPSSSNTVKNIALAKSHLKRGVSKRVGRRISEDILEDCANCNDKVEWPIQRQQCGSHNVEFGDEDKWKAYVIFDNCNNHLWFTNTYDPAHLHPSQFAIEQLQIELSERTRIQQMIRQYDELIMKVLSKALDA